jgi:hypothetical protein
MKKVIHDGERICSELELFYDWLKEFVKENDGLLLTSLEKFKCQIECNKVNAQFIGDPPDAEVYVEIPAGPRTRHNLPTYRSRRPESHLEQMHGDLKHDANIGMRPELADIQILRGATDRNRKILTKKKNNLQTPDERKKDYRSIPSHLHDEPRFQNEAFLHYLNSQATSKGFDPHFPEYKALSSNNSEVFLSEYFKQQQQRNQQKLLTGNKCMCPKCTAPSELPEPLPVTAAGIPVLEDPAPAAEALPAAAQIVPLLVAAAPVLEDNPLRLLPPAAEAEELLQGPRQQQETDSEMLPPAAHHQQEAAVIELHEAVSLQENTLRLQPPPQTSPAAVYYPQHISHSWMPACYYPLVSTTANAGFIPLQHPYFGTPMFNPLISSMHPCCNAFLQYLRKPIKRGRPPHDKDCSQKIIEQRMSRKRGHDII